MNSGSNFSLATFDWAERGDRGIVIFHKISMFPGAAINKSAKVHPGLSWLALEWVQEIKLLNLRSFASGKYKAAHHNGQYFFFFVCMYLLICNYLLVYMWIELIIHNSIKQTFEFSSAVNIYYFLTWFEPSVHNSVAKMFSLVLSDLLS